jgi:hypothetical protein
MLEARHRRARAPSAGALRREGKMLDGTRSLLGPLQIASLVAVCGLLLAFCGKGCVQGCTGEWHREDACKDLPYSRAVRCREEVRECGGTNEEQVRACAERIAAAAASAP